MNKAKYYRIANDNIKRLKNGCVEYFGYATKCWMPSQYTVEDIKFTSGMKQISRDQARKQFPMAFKVRLMEVKRVFHDQTRKQLPKA